MSDYGYGYECCDSTDGGIFGEKDPDATTDFEFNWAQWLDGDLIDTSVFLLPDGLTQASASNTDTTATVFVSGGSSCGVYRITNRITTLGGRSQDRTIRVRVREQ